MERAGFTINGDDGQGALYWKGEHAGFVYLEYQGEDSSEAWKFYPSERSGGFLRDELADLGVLLSELQDRTDSERRAVDDCPKRVHTWERANRGGAEIYVCIDCGEPGFWVPGAVGDKSVMSRDEALGLLTGSVSPSAL
jgi:hypothetical protein